MSRDPTFDKSHVIYATRKRVVRKFRAHGTLKKHRMFYNLVFSNRSKNLFNKVPVSIISLRYDDILMHGSKSPLLINK